MSESKSGTSNGSGRVLYPTPAVGQAVSKLREVIEDAQAALKVLTPPIPFPDPDPVPFPMPLDLRTAARTAAPVSLDFGGVVASIAEALQRADLKNPNGITFGMIFPPELPNQREMRESQPTPETLARGAEAVLRRIWPDAAARKVADRRGENLEALVARELLTQQEAAWLQQVLALGDGETSDPAAVLEQLRLRRQQGGSAVFTTALDAMIVGAEHDIAQQGVHPNRHMMLKWSWKGAGSGCLDGAIAGAIVGESAGPLAAAGAAVGGCVAGGLIGGLTGGYD